MAKHYDRNNSGEQGNKATYGDLESHQTKQMYDSYTTLRECGVSHRAAKRILAEEHNVRAGTVDSVKRYEGRSMAEQRANLTDAVVAEARQRYQDGEAINDLVRAYQIMKSDFYSHVIGGNAGSSDITDLSAYRESRRQVQDVPLKMAANGEDMSGSAYRRGASGATGRSNLRVLNSAEGDGNDNQSATPRTPEREVQDHLYGGVAGGRPKGTLGDSAVPAPEADGNQDPSGGLPPLGPEAGAEDAPTLDELAEAERLLEQAGTHTEGDDSRDQQPPQFVPVTPNPDEHYGGGHGGPIPPGPTDMPSYGQLVQDVKDLTKEVRGLKKDYSRLHNKFLSPMARIKRVAAGVAIGLAGMYAGYFAEHRYETEPAQQTISSLESSTEAISRNLDRLSDRVGEYRQQAETDAATITRLERENQALCDQQSIDDAVANATNPVADLPTDVKPEDAKAPGYVAPKTEATPKTDAKPAGYVAPAADKEKDTTSKPAAANPAYDPASVVDTLKSKGYTGKMDERTALLAAKRASEGKPYEVLPILFADENVELLNFVKGKDKGALDSLLGKYQSNYDAARSARNSQATATTAAAPSGLESAVAPEDESQLLTPIGDVTSSKKTNGQVPTYEATDVEEKVALPGDASVQGSKSGNANSELNARQKEVVYDHLGNVIERNPLFVAIENAVSRNRVVNYTSDIRMSEVPGQLDQIAIYVHDVPADFTLERALGFYSHELAFAGEDRPALVAGIASLVNSGELDNGIFLRATYAMAAGETTPIKVADGEYLGSNSALDKLAKPKKGISKVVHNVGDNIAGKARGLNPFWGAHVKHHAKHAAQ